jgi:hypothetical protein
VVLWRAAPTCDTESNSDFEKPPIGSLSLYPLGERAGVRGMDLQGATKLHPKKSPRNLRGSSISAADKP